MPIRNALVQNTGPGNLSGDLWDLIGASCGPKFRRNQARPVYIAFLLFARQSATGKMASIWAHNFHFAAINLRGRKRERERERDVPHSLGVRREFGVRPLVRIGNTLAPARVEGGRDEFFSLLMVFLLILQFGQQVYQVHKFGSRAQIPWVQKPVLDMPSVF